MQYKEETTEHGSIQYGLNGETAAVIGYCGKDMEVVIPASVEGYKVTQIGKKAFLSNKVLRQITLPESVVRIDDWAFAYCAKLAKIILPYHRMEIGQGIFKDCFCLEQIVDEGADESEKRTADIAWLLAATMSRLDAFYLFDFENAGTEEWIRQWDSRMESLMRKADSEGFSKMLLCGEEDYGSRENNRDYYMEQRRREKVKLAMLRLMHDYGLEQSVRAELESYLLAHIKGQQTEETWKVVLEEYGDDLRYYQFLTNLGGVNEDNFQAIMDDLGESHTEMKAYLMKYHSERHKEEDAFGAFVL
ncbi:MAG: leucine-rich repeat domain-containing protein [Lachnospiraceae bacterium]|nr:leucine-rich repeat domain-containing protein [Lachnospiraceae bacterium]